MEGGVRSMNWENPVTLRPIFGLECTPPDVIIIRIIPDHGQVKGGEDRTLTAAMGGRIKGIVKYMVEERRNTIDTYVVE